MDSLRVNFRGAGRRRANKSKRPLQVGGSHIYGTQFNDTHREREYAAGCVNVVNISIRSMRNE